MNYIVAVDEGWNIGKDNDLLFSISADMKYFKENTMGKTVIMGDRTLLSLPGARPLKGRENIVLSLDEGFNPEGAVTCHSLCELKEVLSGLSDTEDVFVMGGATIYNLLMPYCEKAYITKVQSLREDADVGIINIDELANWSVVSQSEVFEENGLEFSFLIYENSSPVAIDLMK